MDFSSLPLFQAFSRKMTWLASRQKLLAQNVANANTPGYRASDLRPLEFGKELSKAQAKLQLVSTSAGHFTGGSAADPSGAVAVAEGGESQLDGNDVSMEDEMIKVSQTTSDYELVTNLYRKQISLFKDALGRGSSS